MSLITDELVKKAAKELAPFVLQGMGYGDVPLTEIFPPRNRYLFLNQIITKAARAALSVAVPEIVEAAAKVAERNVSVINRMNHEHEDEVSAKIASSIRSLAK